MALAKLNNYCVFSNGGGTVVLSQPQLLQLSDGTTVSGVLVPDGEVAVVSGEFQNRFVLSEVRVWHDQGTISISSSMDGVVWGSLSTEVYPGYTTVSGALLAFDNWPKYITVSHSASGAPASLNEIEIQGFSGGVEEGTPVVDVDSSVFHEVTEVVLRNSSSSSKYVYCAIDADAVAAGGQTFDIATTSGGPFYSLRQRGFSCPRDYGWASGEFDDTTISGSYIILLGAASSGTYTTPVVDTQAYNPLLAYWNHYDESGTSITSSNGFTDKLTVRVRSSNHSPTGPWVSGQSPDTTDFLWGSASGTLQFSTVSLNDLLTVSVGQYRYVQMQAVFVSDTPGYSSRLLSIGAEEVLPLGSVTPGSSVSAFVQTTSSGYARGQSSALTTFFFE